MSTTIIRQNIKISREQLFQVYVSRMFERRGLKGNYQPAQTKSWLSWLAKKMHEHNQAIFLIEQIQPSWLPTPAWQWVYLISSRAISGAIIGFILWLIVWLDIQHIPGFDLQVFDRLAQLLSIPAAYADLSSALILLTFAGIFVGFIDGWFFEKRRHSGRDNQIDRQAGIKQAAVVGGSLFLVAFIALMLFDNPLYAFAGALIVGLSFILGNGYLQNGQSFRTEIRTTEALSWGWRNAFMGLLPGLLMGIVTSIPMSILANSFIGFIYFGTFIILFFLLGGLQRNQIETTYRPNQGIWLSFRNGFLAAILFASVIGLFHTYTLGWQAGLTGGFMVGLSAGMLYGGTDVTRHYLLRFLLWLNKVKPWRYSAFLDHATRRIFLHEVGGGYIFMHRFLMEHFADQLVEEF